MSNVIYSNEDDLDIHNIKTPPLSFINSSRKQIPSLILDSAKSVNSVSRPSRSKIDKSNDAMEKEITFLTQKTVFYSSIVYMNDNYCLFRFLRDSNKSKTTLRELNDTKESLSDDDETKQIKMKRLKELNERETESLKQLMSEVVINIEDSDDDNESIKRKRVKKPLKTQEMIDSWTHIFMNGQNQGGCAIVDDPEVYRAFLASYADDINHNRSLYVLERPTPIFRMYVDFDIPNVLIDDVSLDTLITKVLGTFKNCFPDAPKRTFCLSACLYRSAKKSGVHLYFPFMYVDSAMAVDMCRRLIHYLRISYGLTYTPSREVWEKIVDTSVYNGKKASLRMVGSHKCDKCPCGILKKKKKTNETEKVSPLCKTCNGRGVVDAGRAYKPWKFFIDGETDEESVESLGTIPLHNSLLLALPEENHIHTHYSLIELCTLRAPHNKVSITPGFVRFIIPENSLVYPDSPHHENEKESYVNVGLEKNLVIPMFLNDYKQVMKDKQNNLIRIPSGDSLYSDVVKHLFFSPLFNRKWRNVDVQSITRHPNYNFYFVRTSGEGSTYCLNKRGGYHSTASIYFMIFRNGNVEQRCSSGLSTENRFHGPCKTFKMSVGTISSELKQIMFPESSSSSGLADDSERMMFLNSSRDPNDKLEYNLRLLSKQNNAIQEKLKKWQIEKENAIKRAGKKQVHKKRRHSQKNDQNNDQESDSDESDNE